MQFFQKPIGGDTVSWVNSLTLTLDFDFKLDFNSGSDPCYATLDTFLNLSQCFICTTGLTHPPKRVKCKL